MVRPMTHIFQTLGKLSLLAFNDNFEKKIKSTNLDKENSRLR